MDRYLDVADIARMLGVKPESVSQYRWRDPSFPEPDITLSGRSGWREAKIRAWIASRPGRGAGGGRPRRKPAEGA